MSGPNGSLRLIRGEADMLRIRAEEYAPITLNLGAATDSVDLGTIHLVPKVRIRGFVHTAEEVPLADASVRLFVDDVEVAEVKSAPDGSFAIPVDHSFRPEAFSNFVLTAFVAGFQPGSLAFRNPHGVQTLVLERAGSIEGTVLDTETSAGIPDAVVSYQLKLLPSRVGRIPIARTGPDGTFRATCTPDAQGWRFVASKEAFTTADPEPGTGGRLIFHLSPAASVRGVVTEPGGEPAVGARVLAIPEHPGVGRVRTVRSPHATSDDKGTFELTGVPRSGGIQFRALHKGMIGHLSVDSVPDEEVRITLRVPANQALIPIRVLNRERRVVSGAEVSYVYEIPKPPGLEEVSIGRTNADGKTEFTVPRTWSSPIWVAVRSSAGSAYSGPHDVADIFSKGLDIEIAPGSRVVAMVDPVAEAAPVHVVLWRHGANGAVMPWRNQTVQAPGQVGFAGVLRGEYTLFLRATDACPFLSRFSVGDDEEIVDLGRFQLALGRELAGTIHFDGEPEPNVVVRARLPPEWRIFLAKSLLQQITKQDGKFVFRDLPRTALTLNLIPMHRDAILRQREVAIDQDAIEIQLKSRKR
jgi:hypothetical protein